MIVASHFHGIRTSKRDYISILLILFHFFFFVCFGFHLRLGSLLVLNLCNTKTVFSTSSARISVLSFICVCNQIPEKPANLLLHMFIIFESAP